MSFIFNMYDAFTALICENLNYRRGTARRATSVEILSTAAQLYEKSHLKRLAWPWKVEGHSRSLELLLFDKPHIIFCYWSVVTTTEPIIKISTDI